MKWKLTSARIIPRHLQLAIRNDEELNKYVLCLSRWANCFKASRACHNCTGWCPPQHSPKSSSQEVWKGWEGKSRALDVRNWCCSGILLNGRAFGFSKCVLLYINRSQYTLSHQNPFSLRNHELLWVSKGLYIPCLQDLHISLFSQRESPSADFSGFWFDFDLEGIHHWEGGLLARFGEVGGSQKDPLKNWPTAERIRLPLNFGRRIFLSPTLDFGKTLLFYRSN